MVRHHINSISSRIEPLTTLQDASCRTDSSKLGNFNIKGKTSVSLLELPHLTFILIKIIFR